MNIIKKYECIFKNEENILLIRNIKAENETVAKEKFVNGLKGNTPFDNAVVRKYQINLIN